MRRLFNNLSFLVVIIVTLLVASQCKAQEGVMKSQVVGITWIHSYEEDTDGVKIYRPASYDFPPSRGRTGFLLKEDNSFINYEIAPADGIAERKGSCNIEGDKMALSFEDSSRNYKIEVISIENNVLKIKK